MMHLLSCLHALRATVLQSKTCKNPAAQPPDTKNSRPNRRCQHSAARLNMTLRATCMHVRYIRQATHAATCKHFFACGAAQRRRVQSHTCLVLEGGTTPFMCIYIYPLICTLQTSATSSCAKLLRFWIPDIFRISSVFWIKSVTQKTSGS